MTHTTICTCKAAGIKRNGPITYLSSHRAHLEGAVPEAESSRGSWLDAAVATVR